MKHGKGEMQAGGTAKGGRVPRIMPSGREDGRRTDSGGNTNDSTNITEMGRLFQPDGRRLTLGPGDGSGIERRPLDHG